MKPFWLHWDSEMQVVPFLINGEIQLKHSPFSDPKHVEHGYSHPKYIIFYQYKTKFKNKIKWKKPFEQFCQYIKQKINKKIKK